MTPASIQLAAVPLPNFGLPDEEPRLPASVYAARLSRLRQRAAAQGYGAVVVYGDREHFANLAYLTGYDPRFEEALLVATLAEDTPPTLLVGNEGWAYAAICPIPIQRVLYQSFSLVSQPRDQNRPLSELLNAAGIQTGMKVGMAGWKYFTEQDSPNPTQRLEVPAYIVDELRALGCALENAGAMFMHPTQGLRAVNEVEQLAAFEFAAAHGSQALRRMLFTVRPGMSELEAVQQMGINGLPTNLYPLLLSGERTQLGLASPSTRRLQQGDPIFAALGYWGSNIARGGFLVHSASELPAPIQDYLDKLVIPYFRAAVAWYETLGLGVTGDELYQAVHQHVGDPFFGVTLNPGHLVHLDEWVSSPVYAGSAERLVSGMAWQCDIIPATGSPYFTSNIEDTLALADEALRADFQRLYPQAWGRIQARRAFMTDVLGIRLKPEVLPFSNLPAYLPPFWLAPHQVLVVKGR